MWLMLLSLLLSFTPLGQEGPILKERPYELRAKANLLLGKGEKGGDYYDVVVTDTPTNGVLFRLPYTKKGGKFTFDLHHRIALSPSFALPAEVTTVVNIVTGGETRIGSYTISDTIRPGQTYSDPVDKVSKADVDKYVTPFSTKTYTVEISPGPQSISIVGESQTVSRGSDAIRIDTPGARIATVSGFKFEEIIDTNPLKPTPPR